MKRIAGRTLFGAFLLTVWLSAVSLSQDRFAKVSVGDREYIVNSGSTTSAIVVAEPNGITPTELAALPGIVKAAVGELNGQDVPSVPARKVQAELPIDITGPDQRIPRALGAASFFPVKGMPKGAESDLFMVPSGIGEFFALYDRDGNPVGVFASDQPGTFTCVVIAIVDGKLARDQHTITVGTQPPPGPVPPGPVPPGPTPVPDGALGFTKMAYQEASTVNAASRSKAAELADNFEGVASSIAAGAIRTAEEGNAAVTAGNRRVLADAVHKGNWTGFFTVWAMRADEALTAGTLKATAESYAEIYRATANGLRLVK